MRKFLFVAALAVSLTMASGQEPNYDLASRFSIKRTSQMVFSTTIRPEWFRHSNKFWYAWKTSEGTRYYIVDPSAGTKIEIFDMPRLAMQITEIVKDPFDAKHLPLKKLRLEDNDKVFRFDINSTVDTKDPDDSSKTIKKVFHFRYDIASRLLTEEKDKKKDKYPSYANVSPDGTKGLYIKGYNLYWADSTSLRKMAAEEEKGGDFKDSTIVEHRLTSDGTADHSWDGDNYTGDTERDSTKRKMPMNLVWAPDGKYFATIRWDMSKIKDLWVINSVASPRPKLETYKYQLPGEEGPSGALYLFDAGSGSYRKIATDSFKDQDMSFFTARETAESKYEDFFCNRWLGDEKGFYMLRLSRDLKRQDLCFVGVDADSTRVVIKERMNTYVETRTPYLIKGGRQIIWWSEH